MWDDKHVHDRGKVLDAEMLDKFKELKGRDWGRYQDVDGDAIPYRTLPGTHPTKGAFFTRGTSHDENARYTEDGIIHARIIDRIRRKFDTAATLVPKPEIGIRDKSGKIGLIYFGANTPAVHEALDGLEREGIKVNAHAVEGISVHARRRRVLCGTRACPRGRAEPRRADALSADDGGERPGLEADCRAELRWHADDGRLRARRCSQGTPRPAQAGG